MTAGRKGYYGRCRWWQPQVLHLYDGSAIDDEVMASGHLLSHIEKKGILSSFSDVQGTLKNVSLAYLFLTTFC